MGAMEQVAAGRHEYGLRPAVKPLYLAVAIFCIAMGGYFLAATPNHPRLASAELTFAGLVAAGVWMALVGVRTRLVIDGTHVEVRGAVRTREFDRNEVEGFRTFRSRSGTYLAICLKEGAGTIPLLSYATDGWLEDWFAGLTDLDERDRKELLERIDQDQELGATPEQRRGALGDAKWLNVGAWLVDGAAAAVFLWGPREYRVAAMVVVALAPVAAAYLVSTRPLLYAFLGNKKDPRTETSPVLIISGLGLLLGATHANFVSVGALLPYIGVGALLAAAMFWGAAQKNPRMAATLFALCMLSGLYGWGLAVGVDMAGDATAPQIYSAQVVGGHVSHGKSTSYYLKLGPWGPFATSYSNVQVTRSEYEGMRPGDVVCVELHAGALRVAWFEMVPCGNGTQ